MRPGRDRVDRDPVGADLAGEGLRPADDSWAHGVREREVVDRLAHRARRDVHDPSVPAAAQLREGRGSSGAPRRRAGARPHPPAARRRSTSALVRGGPPPLLTRMSMPPKASTVRSTRRWRSAGFVRSPRTASAPSRSASRSRIVAAPGEHRTFAPSSASASAIASPIPEEAPQTIAVLPLSRDPSEQNRRLSPARRGSWVAL